MSIEKNIEFWEMHRAVSQRGVDTANRKLADLAILAAIDHGQMEMELPNNVVELRPQVPPGAA